MSVLSVFLSVSLPLSLKLIKGIKIKSKVTLRARMSDLLYPWLMIVIADIAKIYY